MSMEEDACIAFPRKDFADSLSLWKVVAHVKTVMTYAAGFGSCLKIAQGLVNCRKAGAGGDPSPLMFPPLMFQGGP